MTPRPESPSHLMEAARDVAQIAGDVAMRYFRKGVAVEWKADGSEVTVADREAEGAARDWINEYFPGDDVLGEEVGLTGSSGGRRWLIDPIDGTKSFVRGVPLWGTMVAVEEAGTVLAGAIHCPATLDLIVAGAGEGCWHNGVRALVSDVDDLARSAILVSDARFRHNPDREALWTRLGGRVATARTWGDCYGYVLVATGRAELMADDRLSPWDVAALVPIIEEAGGVLTDWRGRRGMGVDAVATNARLAVALREALGVPAGAAPADGAAGR